MGVLNLLMKGLLLRGLMIWYFLVLVCIVKFFVCNVCIGVVVVWRLFMLFRNVLEFMVLVDLVICCVCFRVSRFLVWVMEVVVIVKIIFMNLFFVYNVLN